MSSDQIYYHDDDNDRNKNKININHSISTHPGLHVGEEVLELGQPDTGHGHELPHNGKVAVAWGDCLATVELHLIFVFVFVFWGDCLVVVELQQEVKTCSLYSCCGCLALKTNTFVTELL